MDRDRMSPSSGVGSRGARRPGSSPGRACRSCILESKPALLSPAHATPLLAEIVCSNSLRSDAPEAPAGLLKAELRRAGLGHHRLRRRHPRPRRRGPGRRPDRLRAAGHPAPRQPPQRAHRAPGGRRAAARPLHRGHRPAHRRAAGPRAGGALRKAALFLRRPRAHRRRRHHRHERRLPRLALQPSALMSPSARGTTSTARSRATNTRPSSPPSAPGARCCPTPSRRPDTSRAACPSR